MTSRVSFTDDSIIIEKPAGNLVWKLPEFPLSGGRAQARGPKLIKTAPWDKHPGDGEDMLIECGLDGEAKLLIRLQTADSTPFARIRYSLSGTGVFAGTDGSERIRYGALETDFDALTEITLSEFDRIEHSFFPCERRFARDEAAGRIFIGPVLLAEKAGASSVLAYEHGAQAPESFLHAVAEDSGLALYSSSGNFYGGQPVGEYMAPWIDIGLCAGDPLPAFRRHIGKDILAGGRSREPYVFYNTWNYQERLKYWENRPYLSEMNEARMTAEIEAAHGMGIEVFVIDTGWFVNAGDWRADTARFPSGLGPIKERLDAYNMKLGLWFNPTLGTKSSAFAVKNPEYIMKTQGKDWYLDEVWEKEGCYCFCLASGFADLLIKKFIQLYNELGVTYFKLDGLGQHGCDGAGHLHGGAANGTDERLRCYAYRMGLELTRVAEEVSSACPEAIFDFDVTEGGRFVGLGFLGGGKFFSINNGPYFGCFDIPRKDVRTPDTINVFFYPGAARPQICRASSRFDRYVPAVCYLTHQLPDGDLPARENAAAALALGGNGIWGDLCALTDEQIGFWRDFLTDYKRVRGAAAEAYPAVTGKIGGSPEIHEKIDPKSGAGLVAVFTSGAGEFTHVTRKLEKMPAKVIGADEAEFLGNGRVRITVRLAADGARTVFFMSDSGNR
ncbi:MAG: alpha-galactosidase [Firmicutes bacterium]|nr:alpha-galactosidase [Bacillota bacterium]